MRRAHLMLPGYGTGVPPGCCDSHAHKAAAFQLRCMHALGNTTNCWTQSQVRAYPYALVGPALLIPLYLAVHENQCCAAATTAIGHHKYYIAGQATWLKPCNALTAGNANEMELCHLGVDMPCLSGRMYVAQCCHQANSFPEYTHNP